MAETPRDPGADAPVASPIDDASPDAQCARQGAVLSDAEAPEQDPSSSTAAPAVP